MDFDCSKLLILTFKYPHNTTLDISQYIGSFHIHITTKYSRMPKKIAPLIGDPLSGDQLTTPTSSSKKSKTVVEVAGVIIMVGGILVMVFNILFIYFGMHSGWYYFRDSLGTELKVKAI